jgi:hypothetical protein
MRLEAVSSEYKSDALRLTYTCPEICCGSKIFIQHLLYAFLAQMNAHWVGRVRPIVLFSEVLEGVDLFVYNLFNDAFQ